MPLPRPILPGASYLVTRDCTQQQFLLRPCALTSAVFLYCLALAQRVTEMKIHAVMVMSNHYHLVVTDPFGRLPEFIEILNKYVAKCLNAHYGRRENLWQANTQTSIVRLKDDDALLDKAAYTVVNPVAAGLVRRSEQWPGLALWRPRTYKARRPSVFFRKKNSRAPKDLEVQIEPLPFEDRPTRQEAHARLGREIAARESALRATLKAAGRRFGSIDELRKVKHTDVPRTKHQLGAMSPRVATRDRERRISALAELKAFVEAYRPALEKWREGRRDVVFPAGTYKMAREHAVACAVC